MIDDVPVPQDLRPTRRPKASVGQAGIIDAAEYLFAEKGIDNVSLRQIAVAAGLQNFNSVQYHFKDREGLLIAIFRARLSVVDAERGRLLQKLPEAGLELSYRALFDCGCRPVLTLTIERQSGSFAALLAQVMRNPFYREVRNRLGETPFGSEISRRLHRLMPELARDEFSYRLLTAFNIVVDAIADPSMTNLMSARKFNSISAYNAAMPLALACLTSGASK